LEVLVVSPTYVKEHIKVADELFLILALLHREHPDDEAFPIGQILERATLENLGASRPDQRSLRVHAYEHAAANMPPGRQGGRYRIAFRQEDGRIRLLRPSDYVHPDRHQKFYPDSKEIPERYRELLDWAKKRWERSEAQPKASGWLKGLRELRGLGKSSWAGIDPDKYVQQLREDWN
jgi:hypothetical protein